MMEENQKTWERFGEDFRNMSSVSSSSMEQSHSRDSRSGQRFITPRENIWKMNRNPHDKESTLMKEDDGQVKLSYDTSGYKPDELKVSLIEEFSLLRANTRRKMKPVKDLCLECSQENRLFQKMSNLKILFLISRLKEY